MTILSGGYVGAKRCTGGATSGAKALMAWYLGAYAAQGAANLGIYVCKSIAGTATTSLHGEGRAGDLGSKPYRTLPFMDDLADALVANSKELGVQLVIHDRKIWSANYPYQGWRHYGGEDHAGHLHVELTPASAKSLTVARINTILGKAVVRPPRPTTPQVPASDWTRRLIMALPELKPGTGLTGSPNEDVQSMQNLLQARGHRKHIDAEGGADGRWGRATTKDLVTFQKAVGLKGDGICGPRTWAHLLRQPKAVA